MMIFRLIEQLSAWAYRKTSLPIILVLLLAVVVFNLLIFPLHLGVISPDGDVSILDVRFGYSSDEAYQTLAAMGVEGRAEYLRMLAITDVLYPFVYGTWLIFAASFFLKRALRPNSIFRIFNLVALDAILFDLVENVSIIWLIIQFPSENNAVAWIASTAGILKWLAVAAAVVVIVLGIVGWVFQSRNDNLRPVE